MQLRLHHVALTPVWQLLIFRLPAVKSAPMPTSCKVLLMDAMKPNSNSVKLSRLANPLITGSIHWIASLP